MTTERLTSLASVKQWLNITNSDSDSLLLSVIDAASQFVLQYLNWTSFRLAEYTFQFRGQGSNRVLLPNWPVVSVMSVATYGQLIPASSQVNGMPGAGYYVLQEGREGPQSLDLMDYRFERGYPSQVIYTAGFATTDSYTPQTDALSFTPSSGGVWSEDRGVTLDGVEAVKVTSDPAAGEYSVDIWGLYTFSADDIGKLAVVSYSYTPASISHATTELVGEWIKRRDRIGQVSKSLGGQETVSFSTANMSSSIKSVLQTYKNVVPV